MTHAIGLAATTLHPEQDFIVRCVRRYGGVLSHAVLDPTCAQFRDRDGRGLIGFQLEGTVAVAIGDPLTDPDRSAELFDRFHDHCAAQNWRTVFVAASPRTAEHAKAKGHAAIEFAFSMTASLAFDPEKGSGQKKLRQNLNRVRREGVVVTELVSPNEPIEIAMQEALVRWQAGRKGRQIFLGTSGLLEHRHGRRWFVAERASLVIGVLSILEIEPSLGGLLVNRVFSTPGAPMHTNELMVVTALAKLRSEGHQRISYGLGLLDELGEITNLRRQPKRLIRLAYRRMAQMFRLERKTDFWEKFGPQERIPLYLLFDPPTVGPKTVLGIVRAFNAG